MLPNEIIALANAAGEKLGIPKGNLPAIIHVESGGKVFEQFPDGPRPLILYEAHLFARKLTGHALEEAIRLGLATKSQKQNRYPKKQADRWAQVGAAAELCQRYGLSDVKAFESVSYGVGQVLGEHWENLGFKNFQEFYDLMMSGAEGQIAIMIRYCDVNDLIDELQDGRWESFFRGYNGPAWRSQGYGEKIAAALKLYGGNVRVADGMLRMGAKGAAVRELQALLVRAGYQVKVDGDFGPATKKAVKAFQKANDIAVDGVVGPETQGKLSAYRQGTGDKPGDQKVTEIPEVAVGGGTAVGGPILIDQAKQAVENATGNLQQYIDAHPWVGYGLTALSVLAVLLAVGGIAYAAYGWFKSRRTVEA
ncbi:MAG: DUF3380 domain-containing protein [Devosia sp.]|uniref:N-acetylmuramidase domain-containing protein n=1 Tax=Devosia sp. TaxID=1871048 RepID=UPI001A460DDF|nr:N-acetylmuramidase domain-containing protein [Devosia sp.]MBL8599243.1 DUF3380 domain-containing protein [Devosia sp.]